MPEPLRFVSQEAVRCEDCDIRGDLHDTGFPLKEAKGRIRECSTCQADGRGHGHVPAPSTRDPYDGYDPNEPYAIRRQARADMAALANVPREVRRRYLSTARIEALMSEEASVACA